jgi:PhnB protein
MKTQVKAIPTGYEGATPYLCVHDAAAAIEFYKKAFGAVELMRMADPSGKVGHAELKIGGGIVMLSDEHPEMGGISPKTLGGTPVGMLVYFEDVDAVAKRAVAAGGKLTRAVEDQFYGDRSGKLEDPYGHVWWIATHKEDVSPEELERRAAALHAS